MEHQIQSMRESHTPQVHVSHQPSSSSQLFLINLEQSRNPGFYLFHLITSKTMMGTNVQKN